MDGCRSNLFKKNVVKCVYEWRCKEKKKSDIDGVKKCWMRILKKKEGWNLDGGKMYVLMIFFWRVYGGVKKKKKHTHSARYRRFSRKKKKRGVLEKRAALGVLSSSSYFVIDS